MDSILNDPQFDSVAHAFELREGLPLGSLRAVAMQESGGNAKAVNPKDGGRGLMQFTDPNVIAKYNVDPTNPWDSLRAGAEYLGDNVKKYGDFNAALADYNGGPKAANAVLAGKDYGTVTANYVPQVNTRMQATAPTDDTAMSAIEQHVATMKGQGLTDLAIVQSLMKSPIADAVHTAQQSGMAPADIVQKIGGQTLQAQQAAQTKIDSQGFGTNLVQGAGNAVGDAGLAVKQMLTSDPQQTALLQQQAQANQVDPERQALGNTVGGTVGEFGVKAAPAIAAGLATGGAGLVPMALGQAAAGAVSGALTPTTEDGQRWKNVASDALLSGGTAGALGLGGKALGAIGSKLTSPADAAGRQALIDTARASDLPVTAANVSPFWRNVAESMPNSPAVLGMQQRADQAIASKIAEGVGLKGYAGPIDTELLNQARPAIQSALDDATNVTVKVPTSIQTDLAPFMKGAGNPLTEGIASNATVSKAAENLMNAATNGTEVSGQMLQELASELKAVAQNPSASATERQSAGNLVQTVNKTLTNAMTPEQAAAFNTANAQYANLKAVEKMVLQSGDSGVVSPQQIVNSVKNGRFKTAFLKGEAPFQELGTTAADLYGPANGRGLGALLGKAAGGHDPLITAAAIEPSFGLPAMALKWAAQKGLGSLAASENPTVVRLLTGTGKGLDPTTKAYIAKALAGSSGASTSR